MPERLKLNEELWTFILKILIPTLIGVSIKIATEMNKKKVTIKRAFLSFIMGIGTVWLCSGLVTSYFSDQLQPIIIAIIAISSDKIGEFALYKLKVDDFLSSLVTAGRDFLVNIINPNK